MKCPKCGYLGFERVERCRNCGYDFSLTAPAAELPELSLRPSRADTIERWADLALDDRDAIGEAALKLDRAADVVARAGAGVPEPTKAGRAKDLPLFGRADDDLPLITKPSAPRTPLSVRRQTPEVPRLRAEPRATMFDANPVGAELIVRRSTPTSPERPAATPQIAGPEPSFASAEPAPLGSRVLAAAFDLSLLLAIDVAVTYLTMKICDVSLADLAMLPRFPLVAFLVVQNLSYFVAFTTGGQTLGQMVTGIRVVSTDGEGSPDVSQAILRTLVWTALAIPAGLGLLSAVVGNERRGLHDRSAGTRVVRATA